VRIQNQYSTKVLTGAPKWTYFISRCCSCSAWLSSRPWSHWHRSSSSSN